jgi:hypothetical protein
MKRPSAVAGGFFFLFGLVLRSEKWRRKAAKSTISPNVSTLTKKIEALSEPQIAEVKDFVEFLRVRGQDRALTQYAAALSAPAFEAIWNNPEDAAYDAI